VTIPGLVDAAWQGTREHPVWVASVDPPLSAGTTAHLEFWRPGVATEPASEDRDRPSPVPALFARRLPGFEPLGVERYSGALAFRRPAEWSSERLSAALGVEAITEEVFVKTWGALPNEPLTLSGAWRFSRAPALSVRAGPVAVQLTVRPKLELRLASGRADLRLDADLTEVSGRAYEVDIEVGAALRVVEVDAEGLTDWSRVARDRLRLRFDGAPAKRRKIRLRGWIPVPSDPMSPVVPEVSIPLPWPNWPGVTMQPGTLIVEAPDWPTIEPGLTYVRAADRRLSTTEGLRFRREFRLDRPVRGAKLHWNAEPPRVTVAVHSLVTVYPDTVEWVAVLRYEASGGVNDEIDLKLPTAWAKQAEIELSGNAFRWETEPRGATTLWKIHPEHPIWGSQRLVIRSSLAYSKASGIAMPDLAPLGRGSVASYDLVVANATGRNLATEGSTGLYEVEYATKVRGDEVFEGLEGLPTSAYRVKVEGWSLRVRPGDTGPSGTSEDSTRVSLADLVAVVSAEGAVLGSARYEVEARPGAFLEVDLARDGEILWAAVDHRPVLPLRSRSSTGRWLIPLEGSEASRVALLWRVVTPDPQGAMDRRMPLPRPILEQARVPTLLAVRAPASVAVRGQSLESTTRDRLEMEKAEWLEGRTAESIATLR
jgi:hypothetical protein